MYKNERKNFFYKIFVKHKQKKNYIVVILIGKKIYSDWNKYSKDLLIKYCKKNNLGLIGFVRSFTVGKGYYANPVFNKFLFADFIKKNLKFINNVCYLDVDILSNPLAPNIFKHHKKGKFSVVSKYKNTPYSQNDNFLKRRAAFMRKAHYNRNFPLDSALTISRKQIYNFNNWPDMGDYFCSGLLMFNIKEKAELLKNIYFKYKQKNIKTMTTGEEPILNYEILKTKKINWLNYKFQALWLYEITSKYPFLYKYKLNDKIVKECIENSISENYFVHFSGKWPEGQMWKQKNIFSSNKIKFYRKFNTYLRKKLKSKPRTKLITFSNLSSLYK